MTLTIGRKANELSITRVLNAPRELVWKAWTEEKHLTIWWGPNGFTNPVCKIDAVPNGEIYIEMKSPEGIIYPVNGQYMEVVRPKKLVFKSEALDKNGKSLFEVVNTINFLIYNGKTKLILQARVTKKTPEAAPHIAGMEEGWNQSLERLAEYLIELEAQY